MNRLWTIIGVNDVARSCRWYQSLLGLPQTAPAHDYFGQLVDADGTVLLCLHAWGGESAAGMFPDHDYYDPRSDSWTRLPDMPLPVHGVTGSAFVNGLIHAPGGGTEVGGSSGSLHNQVYRPAVSCR